MMRKGPNSKTCFLDAFMEDWRVFLLKNYHSITLNRHLGFRVEECS